MVTMVTQGEQQVKSLLNFFFLDRRLSLVPFACYIVYAFEYAVITRPRRKQGAAACVRAPSVERFAGGFVPMFGSSLDVHHFFRSLRVCSRP